ncbi:MAG: iron-containing alcohol dehydrogenase [Nitrospirota bacterium]|nr:iron-containing alcohol dehydrogenase [Nitrospirota bacterium]
MIKRFSFYMPTRIEFGPGSLKKLADTPYLPGRKALVVIGASGAMRRTGHLDRTLKYLRQNKTAAVVYDAIHPNPLSEHVEEGAKLAKRKNCDFVVGLGGGSTIDSAKSIAMLAKNPGRYWDYICGGTGKCKEPKKGALPIVAIPTTAGTGTESDPWTVITKSGAKEKIGWGNDDTYPKLSIVDPELMLTVPPDITAHTGMDAFFHAVEAYVATCSQPASDLLALESAGMITLYLPVAVRQPDNLDARTKLAWASTSAGICESLSGCISHHSIEHSISAFHPEVPHGAGLTMLSVSYFTWLSERVPQRFIDLARVMGVDMDRLVERERPGAFVKALRKLIRDIGLENESLSKYGVQRKEFAAMARNSFQTMGGLYKITPAKMTVKDVTGILDRAFF